MKKLSCIFGIHHFQAGASEISYQCERDGYWIYKVEDKCVDCGKVFSSLFRIPVLSEEEMKKWTEESGAI